MDDLSLLAERVERAALADLHAAASPALRESLGLGLETIGTATVSIARKDPTILLNRAIGLGVETEASRESIGAVGEFFQSAGVKRYYLHLHPEARPPGLREWLLAAGLERVRGWMKFRRDASAPSNRPTDLEVRRIGPEDAMSFGRIVAEGFGLAEAAIPLLAGLCGRRSWHLYLSFSEDTPAGAGALFVLDGVAWLDWAATLPGFRRRGSQGAIQSRRIRDAADLGCRLMLTTTGEAVEGDPQHSYRNILRAGFKPAYLRENFSPSATSWSARGS